HLMNLGMSVLKREICDRIGRQSWRPALMIDTVIFTHQILDFAANAINEPYMAAVTSNIGYGQALRVALSGHSLALECEQLKGSLFEWHRTVIVNLFNGSSLSEVPSLQRSDLGLWINHKASFSINELPEYTTLQEILREADQRYTDHILAPCQNGLKVSETHLQTLSDHVSRLALALSSVIDRALATEEARDSLTRLFSRRYMHSILQHEVAYSLTNSSSFAVLLIDVDNFKMVNDAHGHQIGDDALVQVAETLLSNVRTSDFVFRYGGEEFLILLSEIAVDLAHQKAENIREAIAGLRIPSGTGSEITLTVSIGIAMHDGHPDFNRVVGAADQALMTAKEAGKDRVVVAN
ncbi:MAG: diguanylate cyclase, partial [Acidobacteria bacterium]